MRIEVSARTIIVERRAIGICLIMAGVIGALLAGRWRNVMRVWIRAGAVAAG